MELMKSPEKGCLSGTKKLFWSPGVNWRAEGKALRIEMFEYPEEFLNLFPEFYFLAQNGTSSDVLVQAFPQLSAQDLEDFIRDLQSKRILVNSILSPQEVFFRQTQLLDSPYKSDTFIDPVQYKQFKKTQLERSFPNCKDHSVDLEPAELPPEITERRTYRVFDGTRKVPFSSVSSFLGALSQKKDEEGHVWYNYASAGGLYPIDVFVYIKDQRVEKIKAGLYYYNPVANRLQLVSNTCVITEDAHYFTNKSIFNSSAFTAFLIYNGQVTMPKYGGMGYFYSCIDAGIMVQLLSHAAERHDLGLCSIGDMNFKRIEKYFRLLPDQVLIHTIECGLKTDQKQPSFQD